MLHLFAPRGRHYRKTERFPTRFARTVSRFFERLFPKDADVGRWNR